MPSTMLSDWLAQRLDRRGDQPLYRQLHRLLQQAILSRELSSGTRLPSSRLLAQELDIARNTVTQVYEQLVLEGFVSATTGRGTFVMDTSPDEIVGVPEDAVGVRRTISRAADGRGGGDRYAVSLAAHTGALRELPAAQPLLLRRALSARGQRLLAGAGVSKRQWGAFMPGVPDVTRFPARVWSRLQNRYWRRARHDLLTYAPGGGSAQLRH